MITPSIYIKNESTRSSWRFVDGVLFEENKKLIQANATCFRGHYDYDYYYYYILIVSSVFYKDDTAMKIDSAMQIDFAVF